MTTTWLLNAIGIFVTTIGALLTFLFLYESPKFADKFTSPEAAREFAKYQQLLAKAVGLLALWLLMQALGVIFL